MKQLRIISRNSRLAMWQAEFVKQQLEYCYPQLEVSIIGITTEGDRILDKSLDKIGGKGLFIKELEYQLLAGSADIAVHSLKDLPANLPEGFCLAAVLSREVPYDALVSSNYANLASLPAGAVVGTSSARRRAILTRHYPHLVVKMLRGNLQTRLAKLAGGEYDAIILAVAGLKRLELAEQIKEELDPAIFIPAIGQGVLGIETLSNRPELVDLLRPLHDSMTAAAIGAEREMGRFLNASCNLPIAGFAQYQGGQLQLSGFIADNDNGTYLQTAASGSPDNYLALGQQCAEQLLQQGAAAIVTKYAQL